MKTLFYGDQKHATIYRFLLNLVREARLKQATEIPIECVKETPDQKGPAMRYAFKKEGITLTEEAWHIVPAMMYMPLRTVLLEQTVGGNCSALFVYEQDRVNVTADFVDNSLITLKLSTAPGYGEITGRGPE